MATLPIPSRADPRGLALAGSFPDGLGMGVPADGDLAGVTLA
jgi:hypothetical protein